MAAGGIGLNLPSGVRATIMTFYLRAPLPVAKSTASPLVVAHIMPCLVVVLSRQTNSCLMSYDCLS